MIEVYPHTAIVSLFELPSILTYKGKAGRSLEWRKSEIQKLIGFMSSLEATEPVMQLSSSEHWLRLVSELRSAVTAAALDRAEDELDAYVCAYVALYFWYWGDERCRVIGDAEGGYITTPLDVDARQRLDRLQ